MPKHELKLVTELSDDEKLELCVIARLFAMNELPATFTRSKIKKLLKK